MRRAALVAMLASTWTVRRWRRERPRRWQATSRWSVSAEALFSWFKSSPTPVPIITDSYADAPGVNVLLGGGSVDTNPNAGFRLTGAYRVDSRLGVELTGFYIPIAQHVEQRELHRPAGLDRPVPAVLRRHDTTSENVTEISYWPDYRGSAQATLSNNLGGGELNATWSMPPQDAMARRPPRRLPLPAAARVVHDHHQQPVQPAQSRSTSGTPPTRSTRATASTACRSARARRTTRARGSAA